MWKILIYCEELITPSLTFGLLEEAIKFVSSDEYFKLTKDKDIFKIEFKFEG